jgi:hypothetical protein
VVASGRPPYVFFVEPCWWVGPDLCSGCKPSLGLVRLRRLPNGDLVRA